MNVTTKRLRPCVTASVGYPALVVLTVLMTASSSCILDGAIGTLAGDDHTVPPPAPPTFVEGTAVPGAQIRVFGPTRNPRPNLATEAADDGTFSIEVAFDEALDNATIVATSGGVVVMALVPSIPPAEDVFDDPTVIDLATDVPEMDPMDATATTITLLIEGGQRNNGGNLGGLNTESLRQTITDVARALDEGDEDVTTFFDMVDRLLTAAEGATVPVFLTPDAAADAGTGLNQAFLDAVSVDYDGDETPDTDTTAFDVALATATEGVGPELCLDPDTIRLVFQVQMSSADLPDGNCQPRDPAKWLAANPPDTGVGEVNPDFRMFIVGGVNEYMVRCEDQPDYEFCANQQEVSAVNTRFDDDASGGWEPQTATPMFDDGTNGDAIAGDNIWTRTFDVPRGVRLGYKYLWSPGGIDWTGIEEWPGNGRLIEAIDVNGDGLVVRRDWFGDEATNKDRQNLNLRNRITDPAPEIIQNIVWSCGGEATLADPADPVFCRPEDNGEGVSGFTDVNRDQEVELFPDVCPCFDFREIPVDLDADGSCIPDGFPDPGPVTPITIPCPG